MRSPLRRRPARAASAAFLGLGLALVAAWPAAARAVEILPVRLRENGGYLEAGVRLTGVLSDRVRGTLERGMPATVYVSVDVWRDRTGWFDQLVATERAVYRASMDVWAEDYTLQLGTEPARAISDLDGLESALEQPLRVPLVRVASLGPDRRYYVIVNVTVKPLTVEDLQNVEKWLSGEARRAGKPGPGSIARLPSYFVKVLTNFSGLGDEGATYRSTDFDLESLFTEPNGSGAGGH